MKNDRTPRGWGTTIVAIVIGIIISVLILGTLPLESWTELSFFSIGVLLVILCIAVAIKGQKGTLQNIVESLRFWS